MRVTIIASFISAHVRKLAPRVDALAPSAESCASSRDSTRAADGAKEPP
jgi:hypothetical protein